MDVDAPRINIIPRAFCYLICHVSLAYFLKIIFPKFQNSCVTQPHDAQPNIRLQVILYAPELLSPASARYDSAVNVTTRLISIGCSKIKCWLSLHMNSPPKQIMLRTEEVQNMLQNQNWEHVKIKFTEQITKNNKIFYKFKWNKKKNLISSTSGSEKLINNSINAPN